MKKVISFSLWGNDVKYVLGAILNADIAEKEWHGWICRFYVSPNVPESAVKELESRDNVEVVRMEQDESWNGMFWRFYAASDPDVSVAIFRDTDSRISIRDKAAVDEWIATDKGIHIMRDNCQHGWEICGGAWGAKDNALCEIKNFIDDFDYKTISNKHGIDQIWLSKDIYPSFWKEAYVHDDWFPNGFTHEEKHPFPIPRLRGEGWEKKEFPEWHSGIEDDENNYSHWFGDGPGHCFFKCPACGEHHDNDYIGKVRTPNKEEREKYSHIMKDLN